MLIEGDSGAGVEAEEDNPDDGLTERKRAKATAKLEKALAREREREEKRLTKE